MGGRRRHFGKELKQERVSAAGVSQWSPGDEHDPGAQREPGPAVPAAQEAGR